MAKTDDLYVALLRGINVGGKNKIPMKELAQIFTDLGCADVKTYIQSGNVIFRSESPASLIAVSVSQKIAEKFGFQIPLVLRTRTEFLDSVSYNPLTACDENKLFVMYLRDVPNESAVQSLDPERSPGDLFLLSGREIYLCLANGAATTKLTNAYFDKKLNTLSTSRNWRTAKAIAELLER